MPQEFLASFAVDIDEGGVSRLERILTRNRELAEQLASAFDTARSSMEDFIRSATEDLAELPFFAQTTAPGGNPVPGTFAIDLNFDNAVKQLETFLAGAKKQLRLTADGSGIVSAVSSAISRARSMLAGAGLKLTVKTVTESPDFSQSAGLVRYLSAGGRFSSPTKAEIAEDGKPEYVIPATKENEAIPLIRSLLAELSASARETLSEGMALPDGTGAALLAAAPAAFSPVNQYLTSNNVSAPVNIRVEAAGANPEEIGKSIYNTAEQYLLRTLQEVNA